MDRIYKIRVKSINGKECDLSEYQDKVMLIVNTASKCGFTGQYKELEELYGRYRDKGLVVLGFPCNQFASQEPGDDASIKKFCELNYNVSFPMFSKISVKGKEQHPLYKWLTSKESNPKFGGAISWNFNKFLIGRDGSVIGRFGSRETPQSETIKTAVEAALNQ